MEENRKLYPMSFLPIAENFSWGGTGIEKLFGKSFVTSDAKGRVHRMEKGATVAESHELADLGYRDSQVRNGWLAGNTLSEIMDMYLDRVVGERVFNYYGRQFPLSVKILDVAGRMPLIVHPDDETAAQRYDFLGKAKLWYVLDTEPGAKLQIGFRADTRTDEFMARCGDGSADALLNTITPHKGDAWYIAPGTVHSASGSVILLEISEASPLDFCLSGLGAEIPEEEFDASLDIVEALDFINFKAAAPTPCPKEGKLVEKPEFTVSKLILKDPVHIIAGEGDGFTVLNCAEGSASVQIPSAGGMENYFLKTGETMLVPAEIEDFYLVPHSSGTVLVESRVEREEEADTYIDPGADPRLPGEGEEYRFNSVYGRFNKN